MLRTEDSGYVWQGCTTPPGAEQLDFRGIQAFDAQTAVVMSSGKGDLSRVYKTTDGCKSWKLVFTNPDKEGFFDAMLITHDSEPEEIHILGDPVAGKRVLWSGNDDDPESWQQYEIGNQKSLSGEGSFAASNSVLVQAACSGHCTQPVVTAAAGARALAPEERWRHTWFATQAPEKSFVHRIAAEDTATCEPCILAYSSAATPMAQSTATAGIFSLAFRDEQHGIAVGGDYARPESTGKTAAVTDNAGSTWRLAAHPPHGYRSTVAYDAPTKTWITTGPNGTDVSTDDGRNWRPLTPGPGDDADADKQWNALSLPFVVGPHGRIGRLRADALKLAAASARSTLPAKP